MRVKRTRRLRARYAPLLHTARIIAHDDIRGTMQRNGTTYNGVIGARNDNETQKGKKRSIYAPPSARSREYFSREVHAKKSKRASLKSAEVKRGEAEGRGA